jgi:putative two-component system response regulator
LETQGGVLENNIVGDMAGETILIVEDNDVLRQGLQVLLQSEGYRVVAAVNGVEALQEMQVVTPDLILSDIAMPQMDGYEYFDQVRRHPEWVSIPFIFLTARRGREEIFAGKKLGVEDYLVKPVTRQELTTTIKSRLARSQQLLLAQLEQAYASSLIMLANAIELRDRYTRGHVERVRDHAELIAKQLGWTAAQLEHLQYGSILHDIGKIHIPESVLNKPGPLDEEEWRDMKKHPQVGAEMIKHIIYLAPAVPVIRYHHERWNGSGYPQGLAGEEIPLPARIVAIADSLDAMCTSRPYQKAHVPEKAYEEIVEASGELYDPMVVKAFQRAWGDIYPLLAPGEQNSQE